MKFLLYPLSLFYYFVISFQLLCYKLKIFSKSTFDAQIISIGNIEAGGSGKTPMTIYLATLLKQKNISHVIVSRGYKKQSSGTIIVNDGRHILVDSATESGDEALLMAHKLPTTPVVVGNNKTKAIKVAIETFHPKIIILDDAFQSHYIHKNIDIVLFNCLHPKNKFHLLPVGLLREPISSVIRSHLIVFTKYNLLKTKKLPSPSQKILQLLQNKNIPYLFSEYRSFYQEYSLASKTMLSLRRTEKNNLSVLGLCGIGDSKSFHVLCNKFFTNIVTMQSLADHYHYNNFKPIIDNLYNTQKFSGVVTTYKDFIKLISADSKILEWLKHKKIKLFIIEIEVCFENDSKEFLKLIGQHIKTLAL